MDPSTDNNGAAAGFAGRRPPSLCADGCGFFGTAENLGLCSKCHTVHLKELTERSTAAISRDKGDVAPAAPSDCDRAEMDRLVGALKSATNTCDDQSAKKRCGLCSKRVRLLGFRCRCGATFCGAHRYPEAHACRFDYRRAGKIAIQKENPVCKADKITDRV